MENCTLTEALELYADKKYNQALPLFKKHLLQNKNAEIAQYIRHCQQNLARKLWRHGNVSDLNNLMKEMGAEKHLSLVVARLYGRRMLEDLAKKNDGFLSLLAHCSLQKDSKSALLSLRHSPHFKCLAEGWISLLKGEGKRALESFLQAEESLPFQALIGMGAVFLCEGDMARAQTSFQSLRPLAKQFACLAKNLDGNRLIHVGRSELAHALFHASFEELQMIEKGTLSYLKTHKAWMQLRMGDHLALTSKKEALPYWNQALRLNPLLKLDVLKRRYLASYGDSSCPPTETFFEFYRELHKHSKGKAKQFIEHLVFDSTHSIHTIIKTADLRTESGKWVFDSSRHELQLLWLHLIYQQYLCLIKQVIYLSKEDAQTHFCLSDTAWPEFFSILDPHYSHKEQYLLYKLTVAKLLGLSALIRNTIVSLLNLNAHLQEELLPLYFNTAYKECYSLFNCSEDQLNFWLTEKEALYAQVENLRRSFPTHFDLIRLACLTNPTPVSFEKTESRFSTFFSESLFAVFKLQRALDMGRPVPVCKKLIPAPSLQGKSREADFRLFAILCHPKLIFSKKTLSALCETLAPGSQINHALFQFLERYKTPLPFSLLQQWIKQDRHDWRPHYHLAHYYAQMGDKIQSWQAAEYAYGTIPEELEEKAILHETIRFYQAAMNPFDLIEGLFNELS